MDGIDFDIKKGETFGLVGESGCGRWTAGRTILGLYNKTDEEVLYDGQSVHDMTGKERHNFLKKMQMIFQDPYASLNFVQRSSKLLRSRCKSTACIKTKTEMRARVNELLEDVGLNRDDANRYPHEFSGGQRQRIGIARSLALDPEFIIADEPISALDVSVQAQVVKLLQRLQREKGLTYYLLPMICRW